MPATATQTTLTKDDIRAMRQADEVHGRRIGYDKETHAPSSRLECYKRRRRPDVFETEQQGYRAVACEDQFAAYDKQRDDNRDCFAYSIDSRLWATVAALLRTGDTLELCWLAGNDHQYLKSCQGTGIDEDGKTSQSLHFYGMHRDDLHLVVYRGGKHKYRFALYTAICPNNSARMVRPA